MSKGIESISIEKFKGATNSIQIDFDPNKKIIMIFGENGTGKSTISDAIDFICNNQFGSIADISIPKKTPQEYITSLGYNYKDIKVKIKYKGKDFSAHIGMGNKPQTDNVGCPKARILRRSQILSIVNSEPIKRYESLKQFIEVPICEKIEASLKKSLDTVTTDYHESIRAFEQADKALEDLWRAEGKIGKDKIIWAQEQINIDLSETKNNSQIMNNIINKLENCLTEKDKMNEALNNLDNSKKRIEDIQKEIEKSLEQEEKNTKNLIEVLQESKKYFENNKDITICPVCERGGLVSNDIIIRLNARLNDMSLQKDLKEKLKSAQRDLESKEILHKTSQENFIKYVKELFKEIMKIKDSIQDIIEIDSDKINLLINDEKDLLSKIQNYYDSFEIILNKKTDFKKRYDIWSKQINLLNSIKLNYDTINEKKIIAKNLEIITKQITDIYSIIVKERKKFIEDVLKDISKEVKILYEKIHPNEKIGGINFYLKENTKGSLEFTGEFHDVSDIPPQAYYSESHLDTLGVCVWLALTKHYNDENTIIIFDDVISSVDQVHMDRFLNMIHEEADNFSQIIFTTHYRPWRDKYRYTMGQTSNVQLLELLHWSIPRGVQHTKTKLTIDELDEYVKKEPIDRQIIASKAGILIESLLDSITFLYRCKLPRQADPNYTLNDLCCSIDSKLKKTLKIEKLKDDNSITTIELKQIIEDLFQMGWIRNQVGCHFNINGMTISDEEVKQMGEKTLIFANSLICNKCGELPYKRKSGSYFECKCGNTRLHPLESPM